jgi:hypothetical protein
MKSNLLLTCGIFLAFLVFSANVKAQTENINERDASVSNKINKADLEKTNVSELVDFSGEGSDEVFPASESWQPFGPYRTINVRDKQKIVGFGSAVFGTTSGKAQIAVSLCYAKSGSPILTAFSGNNHLIADAVSSRRTFSVSASGTLPAGSYSVGYCVINRGKQSLDNNNYVNGWIMVVN